MNRLRFCVTGSLIMTWLWFSLELTWHSLDLEGNMGKILLVYCSIYFHWHIRLAFKNLKWVEGSKMLLKPTNRPYQNYKAPKSYWSKKVNPTLLFEVQHITAHVRHKTFHHVQTVRITVKTVRRTVKTIWSVKKSKEDKLPINELPAHNNKHKIEMINAVNA